MPLAIKDRVREVTSTTGTGAVTLAGPVLGYQAFSVIGDGNTTYYCIAGQLTTEWEVGLGTYTAATNTLARTTVFASSNGGAAVPFSTGVKDVYVVGPPADRFVDNQGNFATGTWGINISGNADTATNATNLFGGVLYNTKEKVTISPTVITAGLLTYYVSVQNVVLYTANPTNNWVPSFVGGPSATLNAIMSVGQSYSAVLMVTQGATPYYSINVAIDGTTVGVTTRWQGGSAPSAGNANSVDVYYYTIIKTAATPTYSVFASLTRFA
jgi:hypothetical protein